MKQPKRSSTAAWQWNWQTALKTQPGAANHKSLEGWHNSNDSKSRVASGSFRATGPHGMERLPGSQPLESDEKNRGVDVRKLPNAGGDLRCPERFYGYGNRPARVLANREPFVFAALHRCEEQNRQRLFQPSSGSR